MIISDYTAVANKLERFVDQCIQKQLPPDESSDDDSSSDSSSSDEDERRKVGLHSFTGVQWYSILGTVQIKLVCAAGR